MAGNDTVDIIQKLAVCDLGREIYHSDGQGHIQVQSESSCGFETPFLLLEEVGREGLWPEFIEMTRSKEDEWILRITRFFPEASHFSTICFVEFLDILSNRDAQLQLIQDSPLWLWSENNVALIDVVIDKAAQLVDSTHQKASDRDIDLSILHRVIDSLEAKKDNNE